MKNTNKQKDSFQHENTTGIGGFFSAIFVTILGPIFIAITLCFATNYICEFAGVDFDAFVWLQDFIANFPTLLQSWIDMGQGLMDTVLGFLE